MFYVVVHYAYTFRAFVSVVASCERCIFIQW